MIYHIVIGVMLTNLAIRMIVDPSLPKQPTHGVANLSFF
jgi:hypothetical protein